MAEGVDDLAKKNMAFGTSLPPIPPSGTAVCPEGRIRIGIFFDGTNNNAWRDWGKNFEDWKTNPKDDSQKIPGDFRPQLPEDEAKYVPPDELCAPTNVPKLYLLFKEEVDNQVKIYASGVGGGNKDQKPGEMIDGEARTGAGGYDRVLWAMNMLTDFVNRNNHPKAIEKRVDSFGFSRGSTQARDFLNKVKTTRIADKSKGKTGYRYVPMPYSDPMGMGTMQFEQVPAYPEMRGILFEYLGIMDTVASEGAGSVYAWGNTLAGYDLAVQGRPKDEKKKPADILNVKSTYTNVVEKEGWVHRTYHQVADDEHRDVFPLEVLGVDPKGWWNKFKPLPESMREQSYPGAHADIGGGYRSTERKYETPPTPVYMKTELGDPAETQYVGGHPAAEPVLLNICTITLRDMVEDGLKGHVPFESVDTLPPNISQVDYGCAEAGVPALSGLYAQYLALRTSFMNKQDPKYADYTNDVVHDPVYLQSLKDGVYSDWVEMRDKTDMWKKLWANYVHHSAEGDDYRYKAAPIRRAVRTIVRGPVLAILTSSGRRDINPLSTTRQRDVHYHGYQISYDK